MRRSTLMLTALAALVWMSGCSDKDPVSSQNEGADSPAGKLVISKTKAGGRCELPPCKGSAYWGDGTGAPPPSPGSGGPATPPKALTATLPGGATMDFVWIKPGTFTMGANDENRDDSPQHQVTITKGFYLGKYEITQGQWESVMGPGSSSWLTSKGPNYPAEGISYGDVVGRPGIELGYIHQLNVAAGEELYRLPTEAEWEYACRAGTTTAWSFGDDIGQLGNYAWAGDASESFLHQVGLKKPNPWGLYDMHGNVMEWVLDNGTGYSSEAQVDPSNWDLNWPLARRMRRGGSYGDRNGTQSAYRQGISPDQRQPGIGARLVRIK